MATKNSSIVWAFGPEENDYAQGLIGVLKKHPDVVGGNLLTRLSEDGGILVVLRGPDIAPDVADVAKAYARGLELGYAAGREIEPVPGKIRNRTKEKKREK